MNSTDRAPVSRQHRPSPRLLPALLAAVVLCGCSVSSDDGNDSQKINGTVHVHAGVAQASSAQIDAAQTGAASASDAATINGNVVVDPGAIVAAASTVNGNIDLGAQAAANSLNAVNGNITIGPGAHVAAGVNAVNGKMTLDAAADVQGAVSNVNGAIDVSDAHVAGGIDTINGNITISGASRIEGGIHIKKGATQFFHFGDATPRIVIGPGAIVQGELHFERQVKLYVSEHATIGPVTGATAIPFSGDQPPAD